VLGKSLPSDPTGPDGSEDEVIGIFNRKPEVMIFGSLFAVDITNNDSPAIPICKSFDWIPVPRADGGGAPGALDGVRGQDGSRRQAACSRV
jgi:hypothetical protein